MVQPRSAAVNALRWSEVSGSRTAVLPVLPVLPAIAPPELRGPDHPMRPGRPGRYPLSPRGQRLSSRRQSLSRPVRYAHDAGPMTTHSSVLTGTRSYLDDNLRVVETAHPDEGRSTLELWLSDPVTDRWSVRTVDSRDGVVGPPEERAWDGPDEPGDVPDGHLPKVTSDFDFLTGTWLVHHRKLRERLAGCTDWDEFESTFEARTQLNGLVSIDEGPLPQPSAYRGMT